MQNMKVFGAAVSIKFVSILGLLMMPFEVGVLIEYVDLSQADAGLVATIETTALALGVACVALRLLNAAIHWLAIGAVSLIILGNTLSLFADNLPMLFVMRALAGLGYGIANATASKMVATLFSAPEKTIGKVYAVTYVAATLLYYVAPPLIEQGGSQWFYGGLALLVLCFFPILLWVPRESKQTVQEASIPRSEIFFRPVVLGFFTLEILLMIGVGAVWSFGERFAANIDLSAERIGLYYALSSISQVLGASFAAYLGVRFGRTKPMIASLIPWIALCMIMASAWSEAAYAVGILGYQFILAFFTPYLFGVGAALDKTGHVAAAVIGMQIFSFGFGSFAGGLVADNISLGAIGWLAAASCVITILLLSTVTKPLDNNLPGVAR